MSDKYYMNILEFNEFKLSDAVKFHNELNPALFDDTKLRPEVRQQLLKIASDFMDHLGLDNLEVKDITLSGSNAAYTYTPHSDIDLHIIVDKHELVDDTVYKELFNAKKTVYNDTHDIKVRGYDVELYVQLSDEPVISLGEYSVKNDKWIKLPTKRAANFKQSVAKHKFMKLAQLAQLALQSDDVDDLDNLLSTIKKYRQAGLDARGEFSPENLAFKALRSQGIMDQLYDHRAYLHSQELSLPEDMNETVNSDFFNRPEDEESQPPTNKVRMGDFKFDARTFRGAYGDRNAEGLQIRAYDPKRPKGSRLIGSADFIKKTDKKGNQWLESDDTEVAEEYQGQGVATMMYAFAKSLNNDIQRSPFQSKAGSDMWNKWGKDAKNLMKEASGYIPSESEKDDSRWCRALSVDVHPNTMKKQAKSMGLGNIARDGRPQIASASGKFKK
jgi:hypothetical protein